MTSTTQCLLVELAGAACRKYVVLRSLRPSSSRRSHHRLLRWGGERLGLLWRCWRTEDHIPEACACWKAVSLPTERGARARIYATEELAVRVDTVAIPWAGVGGVARGANAAALPVRLAEGFGAMRESTSHAQAVVE